MNTLTALVIDKLGGEIEASMYDVDGIVRDVQANFADIELINQHFDRLSQWYRVDLDD